MIPKSRLAPVSADPAPTTPHRLHASNHTRSNRANVLSRRSSPLGGVSYGLEDCSHSLHLVGLASSTSSPIYPRHRRPSGDRSRPSPHGLGNSPLDKRWSPYRSLFPATPAQTIPPLPGHQRYLPASFSVYSPAYSGRRQLPVFPNHNKAKVYRSRSSSLATPPLTGSKPPTTLQPSSTTQPHGRPSLPRFTGARASMLPSTPPFLCPPWFATTAFYSPAGYVSFSCGTYSSFPSIDRVCFRCQ